MNESLAYSLQFSRLRTTEQKLAHKTVLSRELQDLRSFVDTFRTSLDDSVFSSPEYSIRVIVLPKVANTNRFDSVIEFVRYDDLDEAQREELSRVTAIIKEKKLVREAHNVGRLRPSEVMTRVQSTSSQPFTMPLHTAFWSVFGIRPTMKRIAEFEDAAFDTNAEYCLYDEAHNDYVYTESWVEFIVSVLDSGLASGDDIRNAYRRSERWKLEDFGGKEVASLPRQAAVKNSVDRSAVSTRCEPSWRQARQKSSPHSDSGPCGEGHGKPTCSVLPPMPSKAQDPRSALR